MTCERFKLAAHEYFLEHLAPDEVAQLDEHVAACPDCSEFLRVCRELTCREFVEFLDDYHDGALEPERREVFERHLSICRDCRNYLESYRRVAGLTMRALSGDEKVADLPVPEELVRAVAAALRARKD